MIVGTAGHIDHGKTSLVRALTGVDADRLAEEKRRGITIDLGYAYLPTAVDDMLGFVDVPGHERLIHNMLAGATGIDHALLVVAADDGIMPQSREHLSVLRLLGLREGTVVITKCDRAGADRVAQVLEAVRIWLRDTFLADAPVFAVSCTTGSGVEALKQHLLQRANVMHVAQALPAVAEEEPSAVDDQGFRLAVDRVFTLPGTGTVVTGTVHSGMVAVGATVRIQPAGQEARVRGLHANNQVREFARRGQRCALNLTGDGVQRSTIRRGDWITDSWVHPSTQRFDGFVELLGDAAVPLRTWMPAHLHLGTADVLCRLVPLSEEALEPGQRGWVQVVCEAPIHACTGDRFILRDQRATQTMAGGVVADVQAPARNRRTLQRLAALETSRISGTGARLVGLLKCQEQPVGSACAAAMWNVRESSLLAAADQDPGLVVLPAAHATEGLQIWNRSRLEAALAVIVEGLDEFHQQFPEEVGCERERLRRLVMPQLESAAFSTLLSQLRERGKIGIRQRWLFLAGHEVRLSEAEHQFRARVLVLLEAAPSDPPWVRGIAASLQMDETVVREYMGRLARGGWVHPVVRDWYFTPGALEALQGVAHRLQTEDGSVSAARFRDRSGLSRKRAIQVLEYFDRVGIMRRIRNTHVFRPGLV